MAANTLDASTLTQAEIARLLSELDTQSRQHQQGISDLQNRVANEIAPLIAKLEETSKKVEKVQGDLDSTIGELQKSVDPII